MTTFFKSLTEGEDVALVSIDQSKAFDLIDHQILVEKLKLIGFKDQAIQIMISFMTDRCQYVQVQAKDSDCLLVGPRSVVQGSVLSGVLYLIYMLDLPYLTHHEIHGPQDYNKCKSPNLKTFIDDCLVKINNKTNSNLSTEVKKFMDQIEDYAAANRLAINPEKTKIVVVSKNENVKNDFEVQLNGKIVKHSSEVKILGIRMSEDLLWDRHVEKVLLPQIKKPSENFQASSKVFRDKISKNLC